MNAEPNTTGQRETSPPSGNRRKCLRRERSSPNKNSKVELEDSDHLDQGCKLSASWDRQGVDIGKQAGGDRGDHQPQVAGQPRLSCNSGLCRTLGLGSQRGTYPPGDTANIPLNVKLQLPSGLFRLIMAQDEQAKKEATGRKNCLDQLEETKLLSHKGVRKMFPTQVIPPGHLLPASGGVSLIQAAIPKYDRPGGG